MACAVCGRTFVKEKLLNISLHRFPTSNTNELREKWIEFVCRSRKNPTWRPKKYSRICSKHFEAECFEYRAANFGRLHRETAIPTIMPKQHQPDTLRRIAPADFPHIVIKEEEIIQSSMEPTETAMLGDPAEHNYAMLGDPTEHNYAMLGDPTEHNYAMLGDPAEHNYVETVLLPMPMTNMFQSQSSTAPTVTAILSDPAPLNCNETVLGTIQMPEMCPSTKPPASILLDNAHSRASNGVPPEPDLTALIRKLNREVAKLKKLCSRRLLKINALKQRTRRLEKKNTEISSALSYFLEEAKLEK